MRKIADIYILAGLTWLVLGMAFGIWMGITHSLNFANSHAHFNLVGFVASTLFGLILRQYPTMAQSRFARPQFLLYQLGAILLVAGKMMVDAGGSETLVKIGSIIVVLGALGMLWLFIARRGATD